MTLNDKFAVPVAQASTELLQISDEFGTFRASSVWIRDRDALVTNRVDALWLYAQSPDMCARGERLLVAFIATVAQAKACQHSAEPHAGACFDQALGLQRNAIEWDTSPRTPPVLNAERALCPAPAAI